MWSGRWLLRVEFQKHIILSDIDNHLLVYTPSAPPRPIEVTQQRIVEAHVEAKLFLGAFTKLREETISVVMSVCLSVRPHGTTQLALDGFS
jgi:hypothetical protein